MEREKSAHLVTKRAEVGAKGEIERLKTELAGSIARCEEYVRVVEEQRKGLNAGSAVHVQLGRVRDELSFVRDREAYLQGEIAKMQARLDTTSKELEELRSTAREQADSQAESHRRTVEAVLGIGGEPRSVRALAQISHGAVETPATPFATGVIDETPRTGGSNATVDLVDPASPSLNRRPLPTGDFRNTSPPVSANPHDVVPETMKKKMLEDLSLASLKKFRATFQHHRLLGHKTDDWHTFIPDTMFPQLRRRLTDMLNPATGTPMFSTAEVARWKSWDVVSCIDALMAAVEIPSIQGIPFAGAMEQIKFADRLLEPIYYETIELILQRVYKGYGKDYEAERNTPDLSLVKALDRSFKAFPSGTIVSKLLRHDDARGYLPNSVGEYIDAAAKHAILKEKAEKQTLRYSTAAHQVTLEAVVPVVPRAKKSRFCTGCGGREHAREHCPFVGSRWFNSETEVPYAESTPGKQYYARFGHKYIRYRDVDGNRLQENERSKSKERRKNNERPRLDTEDQVRKRAREDSVDRGGWSSIAKDRRDRRDSSFNSDSRQPQERDRDRSHSRASSQTTSLHSGRSQQDERSDRSDSDRRGRRREDTGDRRVLAADRRSLDQPLESPRPASSRSGNDRSGREAHKSGAQDRHGRSSSPHHSRDRKSNCKCRSDTNDDYMQACDFLNASPCENGLLKDDALLAAAIPHPSNPALSPLFVDVLPDTGAVSGNYINEATAAWLRAGGVKRQECQVSVCSGIGSAKQFCVPCRGTYSFKITIYNDLLAGDETISITANEIASVYAVLLGRETIKEHNISLKCFRFFSNLETGETLAGFVSYNLYATVPKPHLCSSSLAATAAAKPQATIVIRGGEGKLHEEVLSKSDFLTPEPDEDFVDPEDAYRMPWEEIEESRGKGFGNPTVGRDGTTGAVIGLEVTGSDNFIARANELVEEYQDVFSRELNPEPADLPPLDVPIDTKKWHSPKNQGRARNQSVEGQQEIRRHIDKLLACGAIAPVLHAPAYSQVLLVAKPGTAEKRLVLDYRALNECVGHMNWPLPNITHMMERIGSVKPKKFAKFDMTKGYWQLGLAPDVRMATAFITWMGIFVWNRIPMGLQPAASYFQYCMLMIVLAGLAYEICEGYIDDIIVHGQSEEDLLANLRKVFERCRQFRITFNPQKSKIGLDRIDWVGHQLDADGLHFSADQLSEVAQFPTPLGAKGLRSFLGLANYFRDHVRHYAEMERPLRSVLTHADKSKKFVWTTAAETAFLDMQKAIRGCAKLYFLKDDVLALIVLRTDASDYGYGAYLCQIVDGREYPILFLSKSFHKAELRWKTQDKECFAIYKALEKFQYLLYNRRFVLETDSRNLTFLNNAASSRVYRWKLAIQRYDFTIKHIAGASNVVADAFSRCVFDEHSTPELPVQAVAAMNEMVLTDEQYKLIGLCHNSTVGHHGVERTVKKLQASGKSWPYLREHVRTFIRMCPCCQKMSYLKVPIVAQRFTTTAPGPMEALNIDYLGPFPEDEYGNAHVLTVIDTFTRAVGLYAVPTLEAKHTARMLIRHIGIFGCPSQIVSDRGTHFTAAIIRELMTLFGTDHVLTLVASKQENAAVENANKRAQEFLRTMLFDNRIIDRWSDVLPLVQRIMMAEPNEVIGVSPAQLLFGNSIQLDRGIFLSQLPVTGIENEIALSDWADRMFTAQKVLLDTAQRLQRKKDTEHMGQVRSAPTRFDIGAYVLVSYNPQTMNGRPPTKFHPRLKGPYLVVNVQGDKYSCRNLVTDELEDFHVTRLRAFRYDERFVDPRDISLRDVEEFYVEKILAHSGNPAQLKTLNFHVKWRGFDESANSWEPWKNLRETAVLHRYLIDKGLHKLIPAKFRENYQEVFEGRRVRPRRETQQVSAIWPVSALIAPGRHIGSSPCVSRSSKRVRFDPIPVIWAADG